MRINGVVSLVAALLAAPVMADEPRASADANHAVARARALEHGEGVARDLLRASRIYCEAARGGDAEAQYSLGWMYANGRGVPRDDAIAAYFFKLAAKQGHQPSQRMLRFVGPPVTQAPSCMADEPGLQLTPLLSSH